MHKATDLTNLNFNISNANNITVTLFTLSFLQGWQANEIIKIYDILSKQIGNKVENSFTSFSPDV